MASVEKTEPAIGLAAVTPSDSAYIALTRGLYVGVSGNVRVRMEDGSLETLVGLAAGIVHPLRVQQVYSTSTTATSILAAY